MDLSAYLNDDTPEMDSEPSTSGATLDEMVLTDTKSSSIVDIIDSFLKTPRFEGDACIVLSMPDATLKKHREKVNSALWYVYNRYCKKDFGMMELLVAIERMVDATKLTTILDNDIKLLVAKERGIVVSEDDLEIAAKTAGTKKVEKTEEPVEDDIPKFTTTNDEDFMEKLMEDDPEEEAEMLAGLGVMDDDNEEGTEDVEV
jgi:hypothetical protein